MTSSLREAGVLPRIRSQDLTQHVVRRYREHHPQARHHEIVAAIDWGEPISSDIVWQLTQRSGQANPRDLFVVAPDAWGIFVIDTDDARVVTYLRLEASQRAVLRPATSPAAEPPNTADLRDRAAAILVDPASTPAQREFAQSVVHLTRTVLRIEAENREHLRHIARLNQKITAQGAA